MKLPITKALFLLLATLGAAPAAHALFHYQFEFDAVTFGGITYAADTFEFDSTALLLTVGDSAAVVPAQDLNGYSVTKATVNRRNASLNGISFTPDGDFVGSAAGTAAGDVIFYFFCLDNYPGGTGTFTTPTCAGRDISDGNGISSRYAYTSGSLTIAERGAGVPEPGTLALMA